MKTEQEIKDKIKELTNAYSHVLDLKCATVFENAPRALMQVEGSGKLAVLYWVLGEKLPKFECNEVNK